jgi:hypothetical protein
MSLGSCSISPVHCALRFVLCCGVLWVALQAQGGEFPVVLLAMDKAAGRLMKRQLLYTAVSRAKKALIIVGTDVAITKALQETGVAASAASSRFRAKLRSARVAAGLPRIQRVVFGPDGSF